jgi:hypothetical protein
LFFTGKGTRNVYNVKLNFFLSSFSLAQGDEITKKYFYDVGRREKFMMRHEIFSGSEQEEFASQEFE